MHLFPFQKVIAYGDKLAEAESEQLAFLLLSVSILKKLLHCSQAVRKLWLGCNSELNILSVLFRILGYCKYSLRTVCFCFCLCCMRCQFVRAVTMKITVFWDVMPYSLVDRYQCFRGTCYHHHQGKDGSRALQDTDKYSPGHKSFRLRFCMVFFSPSRQILG
jgi:hypothetical protein